MKRYETFLNKDCGRPFADIEEDANGGLVLYSEAQAEIDALKADLDRSRQQNLIDLAERDALKAQRDALLAALQVIVDAGGIGSEDMFDDAREAIAKARGEQHV